MVDLNGRAFRLCLMVEFCTQTHCDLEAHNSSHLQLCQVLGSRCLRLAGVMKCRRKCQLVYCYFDLFAFMRNIGRSQRRARSKGSLWLSRTHSIFLIDGDTMAPKSSPPPQAFTRSFLLVYGDHHCLDHFRFDSHPSFLHLPSP